MNINSRLRKLEQANGAQNKPLAIEKAIQVLEDPELMEQYKDDPTINYLKPMLGEEF
jgi:hypothetical protein